MKIQSIIWATVIVISVTGCDSSKKGMKGDSMENNDEIKSLLGRYEEALNASDTSKVLPLYTTDGVFMPTEAPTAQGLKEVEAAYNAVFKAIRLSIKFNIEEIVESGDLAYAKTLSKGQVTILGQNITVPEENRELFVFKKESGNWKIARYMFNKSKPSK
ncbi:SgcJ/EcaC family oxidoreductase [Leptospira levettii]|uniref:YybH family protein n=1 Tax=Leptospira levettii TaxID=2023178 RepID=UPI001083A90D|nr:nuclear transport factor 2 family protein [Leptospira levettii]TGL11587.1 SgcJ/EcaC family oxidoreductase [Leptospira levettii]